MFVKAYYETRENGGLNGLTPSDIPTKIRDR